MAATSETTTEVYPPDIQQLLTKHSKYHDILSIAFAAYRIPRAEITEQNHEAFRKELSSMKELYSKLIIQTDTSNMEIKTLCNREMCYCEELAKKVPNIKEMPQFFGFTFNQKIMIGSAIEQAERRKKIAAADPTIGNQLKVLLAKIEPLELARILNIRLDLAEELKESSSTTSNDPQEEPSQVLEDLEATVDSREPAQIIEDIHGKLQCISTKIKDHRELLPCCFKLLQSVGNFNSVLESRLEREESIIRQKEDAAKKEREENATKKVRQKESATKNATNSKKRPETKTMKRLGTWIPKTERHQYQKEAEDSNSKERRDLDSSRSMLSN